MVNLTQEDFAADFGRSQSMMALWESGKKPIPSAVRRRILDIMGGYYDKNPDYATMKAQVSASANPMAIYRPGMVFQLANNMIASHFERKANINPIGESILPYLESDSYVLEMIESYYAPMLEGSSDVVSISFTERSVLAPKYIVRRTATVFVMGEGRLLLNDDRIIGVEESFAAPNPNLVVTTMDDVKP